MGDKPDYTQRLTSGNRIYQYNRKWERIRLLVDPDNISVLSIGIFADRTDFRPSFPLGQKAPDGCVPGEFTQADAAPPNNPECLTTRPAGRFRKSTAIAAYVATQHGGLTEDMFQSPYVVAGGND